MDALQEFKVQSGIYPAEFGREAVYRDVDTIPFGEDFREHVHACLSSCRVGLVVIGPEWCTIAGRSGR